MGPELNVSKTSVLPKDTTQQVFFDVVHNIINVNPRIDVQNFIAKTCRTIIDDVENSDAIQDVLYTISSSVFARLPDSSMLIATF